MIVIASTDIDPGDIATACTALENLDYTLVAISEGYRSIRFSTTEPVSVARMLGNFWTEFADISEGVN